LRSAGARWGIGGDSMEQAQMEQALERFNEMMEELRPALEAMWEAILKWVRIIIETIKRICEAWWQTMQASKQFNEGVEALCSAILAMCESWRRWRLYVKLIHWHIPHRVAKFIANRWPRRWLPAFGDWRG
jgi:phage-related minor tail protein